ncbi:hypothetical protein [Bacillus ndiopicus]|uniref:hypothetical protein n=1 Tax=Bacillus ndiopicus TaxID=1347368 RepID=UPI0005A7079E|nr:hypothetical protein [Bacillus ndiopicus]
MKKFLSIILSFSMVLSISTVAFATGADNTNKIEREAIENLFANKPAIASVDTLTGEDEKALFEETLTQLQTLYREQQQLSEKGEDTTTIENNIADLESEIDHMNHVVRLSDNQIATLGIKPTVPSGNNYINVYGVNAISSYNGKVYDVFHIYAVSKNWGGFANPLAYNNTLVLMTDNAYTSNTFLQSVEAIAKFTLGAKYLKFAISDFLVLSKHPSFFDKGTTQELKVDYIAQQTFVFTYVADRGIIWFDQVQTTEQLGLAETFTASSTKNGVPDKVSINRNNTLKSLNYASTPNAVQLYATGSYKQTYYVGGISYYIGTAKKGSFNTNSYSELYSIPGI